MTLCRYEEKAKNRRDRQNGPSKSSMLMKSLALKTLLTTLLLIMVGMAAIIGTVSIRGELALESDINALAEISVDQANSANRMKSNLLEMRLRMARYEDFSRLGNVEMTA